MTWEAEDLYSHNYSNARTMEKLEMQYYVLYHPKKSW